MQVLYLPSEIRLAIFAIMCSTNYYKKKKMAANQAFDNRKGYNLLKVECNILLRKETMKIRIKQFIIKL